MLTAEAVVVLAADQVAQVEVVVAFTTGVVVVVADQVAQVEEVVVALTTGVVVVVVVLCKR